MKNIRKHTVNAFSCAKHRALLLLQMPECVVIQSHQIQSEHVVAVDSIPIKWTAARVRVNCNARGRIMTAHITSKYLMQICNSRFAEMDDASDGWRDGEERIRQKIHYSADGVWIERH